MLKVIVSNRLEVEGASKELVRELKDICTHINPEYGKKRAMGHWAGDISRRIVTWRPGSAGKLLLPRGVTKRLREAAQRHGVQIQWVDKRLSVPAKWPRFLPNPESSSAEMRPYQERMEAACLKTEQGIVRSPTGSGKTHVAFSAFSRIGQRSLVVMRDRQLLEQWCQKAQHHLGMTMKGRDPQMAVVQGSRRRGVGSCLTVALQATLWAKSFPLDEFALLFGALGVDEVHGAAAVTVQTTVDVFPARYRLGFSADETRKDRKEFLIYDLFGDVIAEASRAEIEADGYTCPVIVRLVPTQFAAPWYRDAPTEERDFVRLVAEMIENTEREHLLRTVLKEIVTEQHTPAFVFTHRREHAERLSVQMPAAVGVSCGLMLGGEQSATTFAEARDALKLGKLPLAVGSYQAIGQGIDIPGLRSGVCSTPFGSNRQFFNQVRGRICRPFAGKKVGYLYYLWDEEVFPFAPRNLLEWNDGSVEVFDQARRAWVLSDETGRAR